MKPTSTTGSIVHILLIPERYLPCIGSSKPLGRIVRAIGERGESYKMLRAWSRVVKRIAEDQLQECGLLLKELGTSTGCDSLGS